MGQHSELTPLETKGMVHSNRFHVTKGERVNCLQAAIESFMASHQMSREYLAETLCGMSQANFSKLSYGTQGDFLAFVDKLPGDIKDDYNDRVDRLQEQRDPVVIAVEQLVSMAFRVLEVATTRLPVRAVQMAKADTKQGQHRKSA